MLAATEPQVKELASGAAVPVDPIGPRGTDAFRYETSLGPDRTGVPPTLEYR
jgi:hypothetical protein